MVLAADERLTRPPGLGGTIGYAYAGGLWRPIAGVDQGDGTAAMLVSGAGIAPSATSLLIANGNGTTQASVTAGSVSVEVTNTPNVAVPGTVAVSNPNLDVALSTLRGASTGTLEAIRALLAATLSVSGTVTVVDSVPLAVSPPHLAAASDAVTATVSNFPATQPVSGTVAVSNLPATQPVSGTVTVANPEPTPDVSDRAARLLGHVTVDPGSYVSDTFAAKIGQGKARIGGAQITTTLTAVGAYFTVENPATNTRVVYIVGFDCYIDTGSATVNYRTGGTTPNASVGTLFNPNLAVTAPSAAIVHAGSLAPTGATTQPLASRIVSGAPLKIQQLVVLPPGAIFGIEVVGASTGANIAANAFLYEE